MGKLLWTPSEEQVKSSNMYEFMGIINDKYNQNFTEFTQLYDWSVENISDFLATMWDYGKIIAS